MSLTPRTSAPVPLKAVFFPLYSSPCTPTAAPPVTSPSNSSSSMRRAGKIVVDPSHPGHKLFEVLPSHYQTSFFPAALGLINRARDPHLTWTLIPPPHLKPVLC